MLQIGYLLHEISLPNSFLSAGGAWCVLMSINILKTVPNYVEEDIFFFLPWALCGKINAQHAPDRICRFFMPRDPQPTNQLYRLQHLFTWDAFWRNLRLLRTTKYFKRFEHEIFFEIENFNESKKPSPLCETCQLFRTNQFQLTREITHEKSCRPSAGIYAYPILPTTSKVLEIASYWCDLH